MRTLVNFLLLWYVEGWPSLDSQDIFNDSRADLPQRQETHMNTSIQIRRTLFELVSPSKLPCEHRSCFRLHWTNRGLTFIDFDSDSLTEADAVMTSVKSQKTSGSKKKSKPE